MDLNVEIETEMHMDLAKDLDILLLIPSCILQASRLLTSSVLQQ